MDKLILQDCRFLCKIGVSDNERAMEKNIFMDVEMFYDVGKAARSDDIIDTVNYARVHEVLKEVVREKEYRLIETLAERIASRLLQDFLLKRVKVRVKKQLAHRNIKYAVMEIDRP
jgi:7,8-dihydroneopterin aldolase/epimerase/oxygenase